MLLTYSTFYRKFGVRLLQQLMSPVFYDLNYLTLPAESIYHYLEYDGVGLGPAPDDYLFRDNKRIIPVESLLQFAGTPVGRPMHADQGVPNLVKQWLHHQRTMKPIRSLDQAVRDKQAIVVFNYAPLGRAFKYAQSYYAAYYRWKNIFQTAMIKIDQAARESHRQHFLFVGSPKTIPSFHQLEQSAEELNQSNLKLFRDNNAYVLLELWKWLTDKRSESLFNLIDLSKIHLVNLVFQESGKWCVLNLGVLNGWRLQGKGETAPTEDNKPVYDFNGKVTGIQVAKRLLRMYMSTMELRTITTKTDAGVFDRDLTKDGAVVETIAPGDEHDDEDDDEVDVSQTESKLSTEPEVDPAEVAKELNILTAEVDHHQDLNDLDEDAFRAVITEQDAKLDEDFKQLEEIVQRQQVEAAKAKPTIEEVVLHAEAKPHDDHIVQACLKLAEDGVISPHEARRFERLSQNYKTIIAPDGVSTLEQFSVITPDKLVIQSTKPMVDSPAIFDKSMLHSTLNEFDSRYITQVLPRDQVNMVLSLQRAGAAVTNYKVEKSADVLGAYEEHIVKVTPIVGVPSTLRFKIPVLKPDGVFRVNGVPYRFRKQRVDLPIRKTSPERVALTSYYGKTFITRGRTASTDYGHWLKNQLMQRVLDKSQTHLMNPIVADVFDPDLRSPRSYSAVSQTLKGCTVNVGSAPTDTYVLNFDHNEVLHFFPTMAGLLEKDGAIILGYDTLKALPNQKSYLVIDKVGQVYATETGKTTLIPVGTLEEVLGIDAQHAPVEYTSVNVWGKSIPVAIVLGLEMGLHNLLELLRVQPRIVPAGERVKLEAGEFAISFSDETLVIDRKNRLASLILSGFNEFAKTLKAFSVYSFDKRGVYVNLLEANGLGARYVREIDLMYQMFVDPITLEILKEMKEPTTFKGLLFRASQMLLVDQHPNELDPAFMRIRGYERFAGAVYTEIIKSLRVHNGKLSKGNSQIEMKPYAVWKAITEDSSKTQSQEINPLKAIKETEAATLAGEGGRNKRSLTKDTRVYHPNDMGTISESTVDSSDVGINIHTSANPQFTSLRGMSKRFDFQTQGATALLSTSALLASGSDHDDQHGPTDAKSSGGTLFN